MGIPRLTKDLIPYLESAVIAAELNGDSRILIQNVVIDGPSMVYHVFNALMTAAAAALRSSVSLCSNSCCIPSYSELNLAISGFLTDLESCGAKIQKIFFDGALPSWKRNVRIERLEKSRTQLERLRRSESIPGPANLEKGQSREQISSLLWQPKVGRGKDLSWAPPFIVPAAIDHLRLSRWSSNVLVVPDEAESFCASFAKESGAAVLTNDSDLLLLPDMQQGPVVLLLNTLDLVPASSTEGEAMIEGRCWRPKMIVASLAIPRLLHFGFERSKDPKTSFADVLQRSRTCDLQRVNESTAFTHFADQYQPYWEHNANITAQFSSDVSRVDPRLAELICQLAYTEVQGPDAIQEPEALVTLPILLEDPGRDASWAYGRELRRLAYSILMTRYSKSDQPMLPVVELSRKGQRIAEDRHQLIPRTGISGRIEKCTHTSRQFLRFRNFESHSDSDKAFDYIFWALGNVLIQHSTAGKQAIPLQIIRLFLGIADRSAKPHQVANKTRSSTADVEWRLLHLNANVQAAMYSLRLLQQVCSVLRHELASLCSEKDFTFLMGLVESMPTTQELFLDLDEVQSVMQKHTLQQRNQVLEKVLTICGHSLPSTPTHGHGVNAAANIQEHGVHRKPGEKDKFSKFSTPNRFGLLSDEG